MEISIIPTIQRSKKPAKSRYMKPDSLKRLEIDYFGWKYQGSSIPEHCRFKTSFRDDTANGLAKCIDVWSRINNAFYQRQNSQGQAWDVGASPVRRKELLMYRLFTMAKRTILRSK